MSDTAENLFPKPAVTVCPHDQQSPIMSPGVLDQNVAYLFITRIDDRGVGYSTMGINPVSDRLSVWCVVGVGFDTGNSNGVGNFEERHRGGGSARGFDTVVPGDNDLVRNIFRYLLGDKQNGATAVH